MGSDSSSSTPVVIYRTRREPLTCVQCCSVFLAIFLPPLGVLCARGCGCDFFINILLTLLFYLPGIIHALYVIFHKYHTYSY